MIVKPELEGYLKKWGTLFTRWRKRYFTLKDGILEYYIERGGVLRGKFHMKICEIN